MGGSGGASEKSRMIRHLGKTYLLDVLIKLLVWDKKIGVFK